MIPKHGESGSVGALAFQDYLALLVGHEDDPNVR